MFSLNHWKVSRWPKHYLTVKYMVILLPTYKTNTICTRPLILEDQIHTLNLCSLSSPPTSALSPDGADVLALNHHRQIYNKDVPKTWWSWGMKPWLLLGIVFFEHYDWAVHKINTMTFTLLTVYEFINSPGAWHDPWHHMCWLVTLQKPLKISTCWWKKLITLMDRLLHHS